MLVTCALLKAINNTGIPERLYKDTTVPTGWSNLDFNTFPTDNNPINVILRLLTSMSGDLSNGAYDVYEPGVGLGIPRDQIDFQSFTDVQSSYDYDGAAGVFFLFTQTEQAKEFLDQELCRVLGIYIHTGSDGKLRCVRPRHPQKFYIGAPNRDLWFLWPTGAANEYKARLPIGVFTGPELALEVTLAVWRAVPTLTSEFLCQYDATVHAFILSGAPGNMDLTGTANVSGWPTLGWPSLPANAVIGGTPGAIRGLLSQTIMDRTLTQDDMWGVQVLDNRDDRISSVSYVYDYDPDSGTYRSGKRYIDAEALGLADSLCPADYTIASRGLIAASNNAAPWIGHWQKPVSGCDPVKWRPLFTWGVDAATWSQLQALSLLDRYKQPPLKFRAHLKWKWNTLELGDIVRVNYTIPGVFTDFELNTTTLNNRLFEIVELHANFDGSVDATFLGHRYVSY